MQRRQKKPLNFFSKDTGGKIQIVPNDEDPVIPEPTQTRQSKNIALKHSVNPNMNNSTNHSSGTTQTSVVHRQYAFGRILGNGSFGIVCQACHLATGEQLAVKKVLQDPRYKNRELDIMRELFHPNIVQLRDFFFTETETSVTNRSNDHTESHESQLFLNVVMEHVPDTVYRVLRTYVRNEQPLPTLSVRLYIYQLCRSVGYLHSLGICHRDIKPQNLLVETKMQVLKLCDFGSAKRLVKTEPSVAYICSRFYRAPELMLGATEYTIAIDIWSIGCVLGELLLGCPLFSGETSVDQLVRIIRVLGTPTQKQMQAMNPNYEEFRFPDVRSQSWRQVMNDCVGSPSLIPDEALQLLDKFLRYEPEKRLRAYDALAHPFFDVLRDPTCCLPDGSPIPDLFNFSEQELRHMSSESRAIVIPDWYREKNSASLLFEASSEDTQATRTPSLKPSTSNTTYLCTLNNMLPLPLNSNTYDAKKTSLPT